MNKATIKAILWGLGIALYLRFGLEATGWMFYEASHALGADWLYWGYSIFRGAGYVFGMWAFQTLACVIAGVLVGLNVMRRNRGGEPT